MALARRWALLAPRGSALGAIILLTGVLNALGEFLIAFGSAVMLAIHVFIVRRRRALYPYTMLLGAVMWLVGNLIWLAALPIFRVVLW